jgi:glycosyltransferase involved in cell wall biosynthesis
MIYFDVTKTGRAGHASGLNRVSARLRDELGAAAVPVEWDPRHDAWRTTAGQTPVAWRMEDWLLTGELFSEAERPGLTAFVRARRARLAAIFHDAIPLKLPHLTWPQSVARHPSYLSLLAEFDRVLAVSAASAAELTEFWRWQDRPARAVVSTIALGADFGRQPRVTLARGSAFTKVLADKEGTRPTGTAAAKPALLCVGILEPRKNQAFLLDVCEGLWSKGLKFELHLVGRVNPHFGKPIAARAKSLAKAGRPVRHHEGVDDAALRGLFEKARATVFPTIAEGCGLPLIESLWQGVPCVCSDLPVLRENAAGGGCVTVPVNDATVWSAALHRVLTGGALWQSLSTAATTRPLPTWQDTAQQVRAALGR